MSLLATPTFSGAGSSDTFYVKIGGSSSGGVSTLQGLSGAVGITGTGLTVGTSGQNITLTVSGSSSGVQSVASADASVVVSGTSAVNLSITNTTPRFAGLLLGPSTTAMYSVASNQIIQTPDNATFPVGFAVPYACIITVALTATNSAGNAAGYSYRQFLQTKDNGNLWSIRNLQDNTNGITITVGNASSSGVQLSFFVNSGALGTETVSSYMVQRIGPQV